MNTQIKIIRSYWGDWEKTKKEIPRLPSYSNQIVYVWGKENEKYLQARGFQTRLVTEEDPCEIGDTNFLIRKLITIRLALEEYDEIMFLDWDCFILKPLDDIFYEYIRSKSIQCPLYAFDKDPKPAFLECYINNKEVLREANIKYFLKYSWKFKDMIVTPNFGCFYTREKSIGEILLNIALTNKLEGCVDEGAMFIYSNCTLGEYLERYNPHFVLGVSNKMINPKYLISRTQKKFNQYLESIIDYNEYLEHM